MSQPSPYTITSVTPVQVTGNPTDTSMTIYNSSQTDMLYLSESGNPNTSFPLNAGSTIAWDPGKPLYLSVDPGKSVVAYILPNGGNFTDATAIANAILQQGLAQDIADAIMLNGVPSIDSSREVIAQVTQVSFPAGHEGQILPFVDTSKFNSLRMIVSPAAQGASSTFPSPCFVTVYPRTPNHVGYNGVAYSFGVLDDNGIGFGSLPINEIWIPCESDSSEFRYYNSRAVDQTVDFALYGSYQTLTESRYTYDPLFYQPFGSGGPTVFENYGNTSFCAQWTSKTNGSVTGLLIPGVGQRVHVHLEVVTVTTAGTVTIGASNANRWLAQVAVPTGTGIFDFDVTLPYSPTVLRLSQGMVSTGTVSIALTTS